jgi:hypothetical protein
METHEKRGLAQFLPASLQQGCLHPDAGGSGWGKVLREVVRGETLTSSAR